MNKSLNNNKLFIELSVPYHQPIFQFRQVLIFDNTQTKVDDYNKNVVDILETGRITNFIYESKEIHISYIDHNKKIHTLIGYCNINLSNMSMYLINMFIELLLKDGRIVYCH